VTDSVTLTVRLSVTVTRSFEPVVVSILGTIPDWVRGRLVRVGPGLFDYGKEEVSYPMDGMGLLHSFDITDSGVTFKSK